MLLKNNYFECPAKELKKYVERLFLIFLMFIKSRKNMATNFLHIFMLEASTRNFKQDEKKRCGHMEDLFSVFYI